MKAFRTLLKLAERDLETLRRALAALRAMSSPKARVCRNGRLQTIPVRELVPGDVVVLETGNIIPADGRVTSSVNMRVEEAALTGESEPVDKEIVPACRYPSDAKRTS